ncbi:DUF4169 family protein [Planktotalea sp.]|uniref:DUF4169 family protein n=1 Tax=Planktotalea sp. TaxID=2029877 RepID=UPI003D6AC23B
MGKPVNLNRFRKQKARATEKARADQNAVLHGLPKAERDLAKSREALETSKLDKLKRSETPSD